MGSCGLTGCIYTPPLSQTYRRYGNTSDMHYILLLHLGENATTHAVISAADLLPYAIPRSSGGADWNSVTFPGTLCALKLSTAGMLVRLSKTAVSQLCGFVRIDSIHSEEGVSSTQ